MERESEAAVGCARAPPSVRPGRHRIGRGGCQDRSGLRFCGILLLRKQTNVGETPASARHLSVETHMNHKGNQHPPETISCLWVVRPNSVTMIRSMLMHAFASVCDRWEVCALPYLSIRDRTEQLSLLIDEKRRDRRREKEMRTNCASIDEDPGAPTPKLASQHPDDYGIRPTPTLARRGLSQRLRLQSPPGLLPRASSALPAGGPVASRIARCRLTKLLSPQQCKPISGIWTAVRVHRSTVHRKAAAGASDLDDP